MRGSSLQIYLLINKHNAAVNLTSAQPIMAVLLQTPKGGLYACMRMCMRANGAASLLERLQQVLQRKISAKMCCFSQPP